MAADHMGKGRHLRQLENLVHTKGEANLILVFILFYCFKSRGFSRDKNP